MAGDKPTLATAYVGLIPTLDGSQKQIEKELGDVDTKAAGAKVGRGFGRAIGSAAVVGLGAVIAGASSVLRTGFQEAMDASAGNAQLAAGIKSTGNAAGVTVKGLNDMASSIQGMSGQTDDSITAAQGLLLTFTKIKNVGPDKIFDQATLASANMAAKMGGDASSNAIQLGKALNDPVKGIASLTRVGVQFTDAQKDQIKAMVAAGDVVGAQKIILGELETQFGGAAEAAGKSLPGQLERAKRSFEDVSQSITEKLIPVVLPALLSISDTVTKKILPAVDLFIQGFRDGTGAGGKLRDILTTVGGALKTVGGFVQANSRWLVPLVGAALGFVGVIKLIIAASKAWAAVQLALNIVMSANPIGLIITAVAALVAGLVFFFTKTELGKKIWQGFTDFLVAAWEWIKKAAKSVWDFLVKVWSWSPLGLIITNWDKIMAFLFAARAKVIGVFKAVWEFIKKVWSYSPLGLIVTNWDKIIAFFKGLPDKVKAVFTRVKDAIVDTFKSAFNFVARLWNNSLGKIKFEIPSWVPGGIGGKGWGFPQMPMLADGGTAMASGWSWVGEKGPELRYLPRGASVVPLSHPAAQEALSGGGRGDTFNIYEAVNAVATALAVQRRQALAAA